jgi:hypothetical protein
LNLNLVAIFEFSTNLQSKRVQYNIERIGNLHLVGRIGEGVGWVSLEPGFLELV